MASATPLEWAAFGSFGTCTMAAPIAYEQPTIQSAWKAYGAHLSTILLIWLVSVLFAGLGIAFTWLIELINSSFGSTGASGDTAISGLTVFGQLAKIPLAILSSLVGVLFVAVPALYYQSGETITPGQAFSTLWKRPVRYVLAGFLFTLVTVFGFALCIVPGIVVALVTPIFVNRIFLTDQSIPDAFAASFQVVYGASKGLDFLGLQLLAWLLTFVVSVCTCGLGALVVGPMCAFYLQNAAYHKGLIR